MGFGDFLTSHLQEMQMLTRWDSREDQRVAGVEVGLR